MKHASCPICNKELETRHTDMADLPATVVCAGCGCWMRLDAKSSGNLIWAGLFAATLGVGWFVPAVLILLPVYLVFTTGSVNRVDVTPIEKRVAHDWAAQPDQGVGGKKADAISKRFNSMRPFEKAAGLEVPVKPRKRVSAVAKEAKAFVPNDLGAGRPHELPH